MNTIAFLFKDSDCDLCKVMQKELIDNPPKADVHIIHAKHHNENIIKAFNINLFPTTVVINEDTGDEISRFEGFIDSETIDITIKNYETKHTIYTEEGYGHV